MKIISKILKISFINTFRMNLYYFGLGGIMYPRIIASKNVYIKKLKGKLKIMNPSLGCIHLGFNDVGIIDSRTNRLIWQNDGEIIFYGNASIGYGSKISCGGKLYFGNNFQMMNSAIIASKNIYFGDDCLISWDCLFMDTDGHKIYSIYDDENNNLLNPNRNIYIGNHVWIGCHSIILKGIEIPNNCIIAAGTVLSKNMYDENAVVSGEKMLKKDIKWYK